MRTRILAITAFLALAASAQQRQEPNGPPPQEIPHQPPFSGEQDPGQMPPDSHAPSSPALADTELEQHIQDQIDNEPYLAGAKIKVTVDDSSVLLTGSVNDQEQHDIAVSIAEAWAGDRPVDDKLQVRART